MSVTISSVAGFAALVVALVLVVGLVWALAWLIPRLRARAGGLRGREGVRVESAVQRYAFWLGWYDAPRRSRRNLRDDLRVNLWESAQESGAREAIARLGSIRALAKAASRADPIRYERPRWEFGLSTGILAAGAVVLGQMFLAVAWMDGAYASGAARVSSSTVLFPGSSIEFTQSPAGFGVQASPGYLCAIVFAIAFLLASQPWRLVRPGRPAAGA